MLLEKLKLSELLHSLQFLPHNDSAFWHLTNTGLYTVHSMYNFLNSGGIHTQLSRLLWVLKILLVHRASG
jgi:hypothetical protein